MKGLCVNIFNSFNLAEYKEELSGRGDVIFLSILIQDLGVSCENQQEAVIPLEVQRSLELKVRGTYCF